MFLIVFVFGFLCLLSLIHFTTNFNYWKNKNVKGPKPIFFFGNFMDVALRKMHMGMLYKEIYNKYPEEKVVGIYRMTSPTLLIRDCDIVKQVLIKNFESFSDRGTYFSSQGLGQNIFHSDTDTWKVLRNRFSSVFTTSKLKNLFHLVNACGDHFVDYVENITMKQTEQDTCRLFLKYAVGATMSAVFGLHVDTYNDNIRLFEEVDKYFVANFYREIDLLFPGFVNKFNLSFLTEETIKFAHQIVEIGSKLVHPKIDTSNVMGVINNMRKEQDKKQVPEPTDDEKEPSIEITDDLLAAQAWISYLASYGNNTLSLTYAMYHLANNPDVQEKLYTEIDEVLEKYKDKFTYEALKEMKYLEMVFNETLRMHPLTNAIIRGANKAVKIEGTDLILDKGSDIVISPYSIQHDEKYWPEPERFIPERFLPENVLNRHPCAFLSFGAGRRSCLGSRLGHMLYGVGVVKILSKFRVKTTKNTVRSIKYDAWRLLLTPEEPIQLKFVPRER
ncbi:cytochrome P450 6B5-like [Anticarsia gemmatalis]|uniref:cytochrome P450 6B5-like n=1 Tax=Anticarsia gemmatalis TaxID=129554 RepID=UPI003F75A9AB